MDRYKLNDILILNKKVKIEKKIRNSFENRSQFYEANKNRFQVGTNQNHHLEMVLVSDPLLVRPETQPIYIPMEKFETLS